MKVLANRPDLNQRYKNPFKDFNFYPYNQISRVLVDSTTGEIINTLHELDSRFTDQEVEYQLDETRHDIMVKIPAFYARRNWKGEELEDSFIAEIPPNNIAKIPNWITELGFELFDCFKREDGSIRPYVLVSAFEGWVDSENKLRSLPYKQPTVNKTIQTFRQHAHNKGTGWEQVDFNAISALQFLYKLAFQNLNSQLQIGQGITNKQSAQPTGQTMALGNQTGFGTTDWGIEEGYDAPDPRIVGILGVQDGQFKYWFKDPTIKPEGIEGAINQHDNGVVTSESGKFIAKVNNDSLYVGEGYENLAKKAINTSTYWYPTNSEHSSDTFQFVSPYEVIISKKSENNVGEIVINSVANGSQTINTPFTVSFDYEQDVVNRAYFEIWGGRSILYQQMQWDKKSHFSSSSLVNTTAGTSNRIDINFLDGSSKFEGRISNIIYSKTLKEVPFIKNSIPKGKIDIHCNWAPDSHSVICKNAIGNKLYANQHIYPISSSYCFGGNVLLEKKWSAIMSKLYSKTIFEDNTETTLNYVSLSNGNKLQLVYPNPEGSVKNIEQYIFYEGQLTEEELKVELAKNLKIPSTKIPANLPDYKGKSNQEYSTFTNLNTDFPLVKNAFYQIKDSTGEYLNKIENDDSITYDDLQKIQIVSGKIRVKDITAPYQLKIIESFPFAQNETTQLPDDRITGCIMADSQGLKSWFKEPGVKIKGIENARVVEDTEDYQILADGDVVIVENYVTGTYDTYNERLKAYEQNPKTTTVPLIAGATEPTIDHAKLLKEINQEKLDELMQAHHLATAKLNEDVIDGIQPLVLAATKEPVRNYKFTENWKHIKQGQEIQIHYFIDSIEQDQFELNTPNDDLVKINGMKVTGLKPGTAVISTDKASFCLIIEADESAHVAVPPKPEPKPIDPPKPTPKPIPLPDLPSKSIPVPVDFCCRIDKHNGEIYIGTGYENILDFRITTNSNGYYQTSYYSDDQKQIFNFNLINNGIEIKTVNYVYGHSSNKEDKYYLRLLGECQSLKYNIVGASNWTFNGKFSTENNIIDIDLIGTVVTDNTTTLPTYIAVQGMTEDINNLKLSIDKTKSILVRSSIPKAFVKSIMPNGKLSIITNLTALTHSFVAKGINTIGSAEWNYFINVFGDAEMKIFGAGVNKDTNINMLKSPSFNIGYKNDKTSFIPQEDKLNLNTKNRIFIGSWGGYDTSRSPQSFKQFLIYKNNLTEQELKAENSKNIVLNIKPTLEYVKEPVKEGLICWLDARDGINGNTTWKDRSGNENNATLYNFDWTSESSFTETGLKFNGIDNYAIVDNLNELLTQENLTVELNFTVVTLKEQTAYLSRSSINIHNGFIGCFGNTIDLWIRNSVNWIYLFRDNQDLYKKKNIICTINNTKEIKGYSNSILKSENINIDSSSGISNKFVIGASGDNSRNFSNIIVHSLRIYDKSLTPKEIKQNYIYEKNIYRG